MSRKVKVMSKKILSQTQKVEELGKLKDKSFEVVRTSPMSDMDSVEIRFSNGTIIDLGDFGESQWGVDTKEDLERKAKK